MKFSKIAALLIYVKLLTLASLMVFADQIEEIVVIANKYPVPASEVVGSVDSILRAEIETRLVNDLSDLLDKTIGVSVPRSNSYGRSYDEGISIRGLGGKRVNILVDGVRVADSYTGYGRDVVEVDLLQRVEVLKGPSSALYGSDGLAGAVAYTTKDPSDLAEIGEQYFSITSSYDQSSENRKVGLLGATSNELFEALLQVTVRQLSELDLHNDAKLALNPLDGRQSSVFGKIKIDLSDSVDVSFTADLQAWEGQWILTSDEGMSYFPATVSTVSSLGDDEGNRHRFAGSLNFSQGLGFFDTGTVSIFWQETDQKQITSRQKTAYSMGPPTALMEYRDYQFNQSIKGVSVNLFKKTNFFGKPNNIIYGFEFESSEASRPRVRYEENLVTGSKETFLGGEFFPSKPFPDTEVERTAIFFNDVIEFNSRTSVSFGMRYDGYQLTPKSDALYEINAPSGNELLRIDDSNVSLKLGVIRDLSENVSAFAQYAEGFRSPDYESANLSFLNQAYRYAVESPPGLDSETSEGLEIGFRGSLYNVAWSLAFYDNGYEDFIDTEVVRRTAQGISIYQYKNLSSVDIQGFEFNLEANLTENLKASFAFNVAEGEEEDGSELLSVDPREALLGVVWNSLDQRLTLSGYASAVGGSPDNLPPSCGRSGCNPLLELSGLVTYDVYASYQLLSNFKVKLAVRNLTDKAHWNWASVRGKSASDPNLDLFMEPGRNISVSFKYEM
jgi:hemoglobin/transferrin/lactoferrin receptor protein